MKKRFIIVLFFILKLAACSDNNRQTYRPAEIMPDTVVTTVEATPEAENTTAFNKKKAPSSPRFTNLHGITNIQKILCQAWVMDDDIHTIQNKNEPEGNEIYRCLYLFNDYTYTRNIRSSLEYGTWRYNDATKIFSLNGAGNSTDEYKIAAIGPDDMIILNHSEGSATKLTYLADGVCYKNNSDDPYYIENNRWRIAPKVSETDEQIRQRLKSFINFHILFYKDNIERNSENISFYGFPTCVKWYGAGIGIINEDELPENWIDCFYNKAEAVKAQKMMKAVISKKYNWPKENIGWVKKNLNVLEQMYANL
jgi:hypothetical protein